MDAHPHIRGMRAQLEVGRLVRANGVILRRDHPRLHDALDRMLACGQLASILPGVLVAAGTENDPNVRIHNGIWNCLTIITSSKLTNDSGTRPCQARVIN